MMADYQVGAVANATGAVGAVAQAIGTGTGGNGFAIYQSGFGNGGAAKSINVAINNGVDATMSVHFTADANAAAGNAVAQALQDFEIFQIGTLGDAVTANITNDGVMDVSLSADASAPAGSAVAQSVLTVGITSNAFGADTANASIVNNDLMTVGLGAVAVGDTTAVAQAVSPIRHGSKRPGLIGHCGHDQRRHYGRQCRCNRDGRRCGRTGHHWGRLYTASKWHLWRYRICVNRQHWIDERPGQRHCQRRDERRSAG